MKRSYKGLAFALILVVAVVFSFAVPAESVSAASKTKKMTVYYCIKSKSTVYCSNANHIFKVNLKTKKVTILTGGKCYPGNLKLKGKYLYYQDIQQGFDENGYAGYLYRINVKTKAKKKLAGATAYAIKGKKIYVTADKLKGDNSIKTTKRVMKLNGKSKKKTKYKAKNACKQTNAKGYYVTDDIDWDDFDQPANYYLRTPSGYILLETLQYPVI